MFLFFCIGQVETVQFLIENGSDVNAKKNNNETALHEAVRNGKSKTNCNNDECNESKLFQFSYSGSIETVKALVLAGADVNSKRYNEETVLHEAARNGKSTRNVTEIQATNQHSFIFCCCLDAIEIVQFLIENGADINTKKYNQETPLNDAVRAGKSRRFMTKIVAKSKLFHFSFQVMRKRRNFS